MVLRREEGTEFAECKTASGTLRAWVLARDVYATQGEGHMQDAHFEFIKAYGEERIARAGGKVYVFHDWMEMTGFDSSSRVTRDRARRPGRPSRGRRLHARAQRHGQPRDRARARARARKDVNA